jgi:hypothetical protein
MGRWRARKGRRKRQGRRNEGEGKSGTTTPGSRRRREKEGIEMKLQIGKGRLGEERKEEGDWVFRV